MSGSTNARATLGSSEEGNGSSVSIAPTEMPVFEERAPNRPSWECLRKPRCWRQSTDRLVIEKNQEGFRANLSGNFRGLGRPRRGRSETADQFVDVWCHCSAGENAHYSSAVVKSLELSFSPCDLAVRVAADQGCIPDLLGDGSDFCGEMIAAPKAGGNTVEEQSRFGASFSNGCNSSIRRPFSSFRGRLVRTLHDPNYASGR